MVLVVKQTISLNLLPTYAFLFSHNYLTIAEYLVKIFSLLPFTASAWAHRLFIVGAPIYRSRKKQNSQIKLVVLKCFQEQYVT